MEITMEEIKKRVRKANGLRGRQKIIDVGADASDQWIFYSNAIGGYGESLSFHYTSNSDLLRDIAPDFSTIVYVGNDTYKLY